MRKNQRILFRKNSWIKFNNSENGKNQEKIRGFFGSLELSLSEFNDLEAISK